MKKNNFNFYKVIVFIFIFTILPFILNAAPKTYIFKGDKNYPPFEYLNDENEPDGFNVEIMKEIANVMGLNIKIELDIWNKIRLELENGEIDGLIGMYQTEEREKKVSFSTPQFIASYAVFIRKGSSIRDISDLYRKMLVVQESDLAHDFIKNQNITEDLLLRKTVEAALKTLAKGKGDAAVLPRLQTKLLLAQNKITNVKSVGQPIIQRNYCIAVKKGDKNLVGILNEGLNILQTSGKYEEIYQKWFGVSYEYNIWALFLKIFIPLSFLIIIVLLWNWILRKKVAQKTFELKKSKENIAITLNSIGDAVISTDCNGRIVRMNPVAEKLTGWTLEEAKNLELTKVFKIINSKSRQSIENPVDEVLRNGKIIGLVNHTILISKDGKEYQIADSAAPIVDNKKNITGVVLVFRDVTEGYGLRQKIKESEKKYKTIFEYTGTAACLLEEDGTISLVNNRFSNLAETTSGNIIGKKYTEFIKKSELSRVVSTHNEIFQNKNKEYEFSFLTAKKNIKNVIIVEKYIPQIGKSIASIIDITERKNIEEKLIKEHDQLELVMQSANIGWWTWNLKTRKFYNSEIIQNNLKFEDKENKTLWMIHPDDSERDIKLRESHFAGNSRFFSVELRLKTKSGKWQWFLNYGKVSKWDKEGNPLLMSGTLRDIDERKRYEISLEENEKRFKKLVDYMPVMIDAINEKGEIVLWNKECERVTGFKAEEIIKNPNAFNMLYKDPARLAEVTAQVNENTKEFRDFEWGMKHKDGGMRMISWANISTKVQIPGWTQWAVGVDVTNRNKAEDALKKSEHKLKTIFNAMRDIVIELDREGRYLEVAPTSPELLYDKKEHIIGDFISNILPKEVAENILEKINIVLDNKIVERVEYYLYIKGEKLWFDASIVPKSEDSVIFVARDITETHKAKIETKESQEKFAAFMNYFPGEVFIKDENLKLIYSNNYMKNLYNHPNKINKTNEIYNEDQASTIIQNHRKALRDGSYKSEELLKDKNGKLRTFWSHKFVIKLSNLDKKLLGGIALDITGQKQAEAELQKMQKLKSLGTLAGGIAHDVNNILTGIYGNLSIMKMKLSQESGVHKYLQGTEKSMHRATKLTKQLLTFAKGGDPVKESVGIKKLIKEVAKFDLTGSNVKPIFNIDSKLWHADVDKGQIQQVFSNLIINANQAMPDGGVINFDLYNYTANEDDYKELDKGNYIKITIKDQGTGISEEYLKRIFDPYFTTKQSGNGLGLATVYSIIKKHGGIIYATSELGVGTKFTIILPASEHEEKAENYQNSPKMKIEDKDFKILVMDDESMIRQIAKDMIELLGLSSETVSDGESALERYKAEMKNNPFDLVIMDLTIPGKMGGEEAVAKLLKIDPKAKVVVSSGYASSPLMANYEKYGFKGMIEKPYTLEKLKKILGEFLD